MKNNKRIKDIPNRLRPRERSLEVGFNNLSDQEVLAILLRGGYKDHSSIDVAISLLKKYGSLNSISKLYIDELSRRGLLSEGKKIVIK